MNFSQEDFMSEYKPIYISHRSKNIQDAVNTTLNTTPAPQKRPRKFARWVIVMTLMSLLGVGIQNAYSSLTDSDFFLMTHIRVLGNSLMSETEILALSQLQVGVGIAPGQPTRPSGRTNRRSAIGIFKTHTTLG